MQTADSCFGLVSAVVAPGVYQQLLADQELLAVQQLQLLFDLGLRAYIGT